MKDTQNIVTEENKALTNRLNRIIGQINGIKKMIEGGKPCADVLIQMSAIISSLKSTEHAIFAKHFNENVIGQIKQNNQDAVNKTLDMIKKL